MLNILIVDDHQVLADGIKALLQSEEDLHVAHYAENAAEALSILAENPDLDLALLDINLPDMDGVALCEKIQAKHPELAIIALTMHHEPGIISRMIQAGARGYLLKNTGKKELVEAIRLVQSGRTYYSQDVTQRLLSHMHSPGQSKSSTPMGGAKVTRREREVLKLIVEEFTTEQIAEKLFISPSTVISHRKSLLRKLNAKNSAGLVKAAYEQALLS